MGCFTGWITALIIFDLFHITLPQKVCAYLDPGTGSFIFQIIIAVLFGSLFAVKLFWNSIKIFFKNLFSSRIKRKDED